MHVSPQGRKAAAVLGLGQRMTYGQGKEADLKVRSLARQK
jgi:hypothetical protein